MKRKQINNLIPKVGIAVIASILLILVMVGIYRDSTAEICSGFMGTKASCIEETAIWPFGLIASPILLLLGAWWTINYVNKEIDSTKPQSKK